VQHNKEVKYMEKKEYTEFYGRASPGIKAQMPRPEVAYPEPKKKAEVAKGGSKGPLTTGTVRRAGGLMSSITGLVTSAVPVLGKIRIPKGITHPDKLIKNKELYFGSGEVRMPTGERYEDWHQLYLGKVRKGVPEGTGAVYSALQQGYDVNQLEVVTGLPSQQVSRSLQYLKSKNLVQSEGG
jgi:hypothetical protein